MGYVIILCLESRRLPPLQLQDTNESSQDACPLTGSVLEPMNLLSKLLPTPISITPQEIESSVNETNFQTELYDSPCHRDFFLNENKQYMKTKYLDYKLYLYYKL